VHGLEYQIVYCGFKWGLSILPILLRIWNRLSVK